MEQKNYIKGYKVFDNNWCCRNFQYSCPGVFEDYAKPIVQKSGFHFCKNVMDCFKYYEFNCFIKVAEVIALGDIDTDGTRYCTNKLEIVREVHWNELLRLINVGWGCTGIHNSGDQNSGNSNSGDKNSGSRNIGNMNTGDFNRGDKNTGDKNTGYFNTGSLNIGNWNSGRNNIGHNNSGHCNTGDYNSGDFNIGSFNSGDFNSAYHSNGCFNTSDGLIYIFNKPSDWTYCDWYESAARKILMTMPHTHIEYIKVDDMSDAEKKECHGWRTTDGYLKIVQESDRQKWWNGLSCDDKSAVLSLPNFDQGIFKEITGIIVD